MANTSKTTKAAATTAVKTATAAKVEPAKVEAPKAEVKEEVKVAPAKKAVAKPAEKKPVAKKVAANPAEKKVEEKKAELYVQFSGFEFSYDELLEKVKADYIAQTGKKAISSTKLYLKPEELKVYYVINDKFMGDIYLG